MDKTAIDIFLERFTEYGDQPCLGFRDKEISYRQLLELISRQTELLEQCHVKAGDIVTLVGDYSPESVAMIFALAKLSTISVPLLPLTLEKNPGLMDIVRPDFIFEQLKDGSLRGKAVANSAGQHQALIAELRQRNVAGLILFTSGSTGEPKAVLHDFSLLLEKFVLIKKSFRSLNFLLFDHWGGLNTLFSILTAGNFLALPENRAPEHICQLIERYQLELLPASPSFLNLLMVSATYKNYDLSSLKLITYGAEPMPAYTLEKLASVFPDVEFRQTYGLIELGVLRAKSKAKDSLWVKIGGEGYDIRVRDGLLEIKAESAMLGYLNAPSPFTDDGYFMTGDKVEIEGDYFRIIGRASELINVGGQKVYPLEVENVLLQSDKVKDAAVFAEKHPLMGHVVCARIVLATEMDHKTARIDLKKHCAQYLEAFKIPVKMEFLTTSVQSDRLKRYRR